MDIYDKPGEVTEIKTNNQKIAFIICVNNETYFAECEYYIRHLHVPDSYEIDVLGIRGATSMCAAYNLGMQSTDACYKVYLHQDVFIRNTNFIVDMLRIFGEHPKVGMLGMVGGIGMPRTGVTYLAWNAGTVDCREPDMAYRLICAPNTKWDTTVDAVDGLLMATQYDVPWREDLFHNFDFYDVSQSFEMKRRGYQILVPYQREPWVIHDSSFAKLNHYDENRRICLREYPEYFTAEDGFAFTYHAEWEALSEELAGETERLMSVGDWESIASIMQMYRKNAMKNSRLETYGIMSDIYQAEKGSGIVPGFFDDCGGYEQAYAKYSTLRLLLRRLEVGMPEDECAELTDAVREGQISCDVLVLMVLHGALDKKSVASKLAQCYGRLVSEGRGDKKIIASCAKRMRAVCDALGDKPLPFAYSKRVQESFTLSVCIITKNEEKNIERCLACLTPYGFELIVADTGSADATKEVAARFTDHVYDFPWCDDFAAAKNFAIEKAANPYVMVIDSDEFIEDIDLAALERLVTSHPEAVGRIRRKNTMTRNGVRQENQEWINRIFARDKFHYEGRIHEQVMALDGAAYETWQAPVIIVHTGYDLPEDARREKAKRNIALLERELEYLGWCEADAAMQRQQGKTSAMPDERIPYLLYQLGKSYYMAGDYAQACIYFARGLTYDLEPKLEYVIDMVETYGYALINNGQPKTALFFENIYDEFADNADFQFLMGLIYMNNGKYERAIEEFQRAMQHKECRNQGVNSYAANYNIGVIYECTGRKEKAECFYRKCGAYRPAEDRLREMGFCQ